MQDGTLTYNFMIPETQSGGEYYIKFKSAKVPESYRKFRINKFLTPELFVTADFENTNYSPGDTVSAKVKARQPNGETLPAGSSISYSVSMPITDKTGQVVPYKVEMASVKLDR